MKEAAIQAGIQRRLAQRLPGAVVWKLADRFTRGLPDLLILYLGRPLALEVKTPKGKQSALQAREEARLEAAGVPYRVVRGWDDVEAALEAMGW